MTGTKPDAAEITSFVHGLRTAPFLHGDQRKLPGFLFHLTDVRNAVSILTTGSLLSRNEANARGLMQTDNASRDIVDSTDPEVWNYARLYFRPKTPTFARNEGMRPVGQWELGAHCPMPVALVFRSDTVMGRTGTRFSDGNLASRNTRTGSSIAFLRSLPFEMIYHQTSLAMMTEPDKRTIIRRRQSEVIVPGELPLAGHFVGAYLRSEAELHTFQDVLRQTRQSSPELARPRLMIDSGSQVFFKKWSFLEHVLVLNESISLNFNPDSKLPGPFELVVELCDPDTRLVFSTVVKTGFHARGKRRIDWPDTAGRDIVMMRILLDGCLAYQNLIRPREGATTIYS